ncbi:MAG: hypothetical protein ACREJC_10485 [Tepidisphaeraceae bacterium]
MAAASHLPLPDKGPGSAQWWDSQLEWATETRKDLLKKWRANVNAYRDEVVAPRPESIRVNIEYEKTEQKKHQLFYRVPALKLRAHPRTIRDSQPAPPGQSPRDLKKAVAIFREVLTYLAGPRGANTKAVMDEVLFDVLCPAGFGMAKVGYERYEEGTVPVKTGEMEPDPNYTQQPGVTLGLRPVPMVPVMGEAPNVVAERYYCSRISPAKALIPPDFSGSDYTEADYLAHDFWIGTEEARRRRWALPPNPPESTEADEDRVLPLARKGERTGQIHCRELFYYASRFDPDVIHPQKIRRLIFLVGGPKDPIYHQDYKDQRFNARGQLVGGLRTLPLRVLTLRYVSDTAFPPSDCTITRRQSDELAEFRTQMVIHRRKAVPMRWMDIHGIIDERVKALLQKGEYYDTIPTDGPGDKFLGEIARAQYPRENYAAVDYILADTNRAWALGMNQAAQRETAGTTATEITAIEKATATRLGGEREKVVNQFWIGLVESLGDLVQLYADREDYVEIVGESGERSIQAWDRETIRGTMLYDIVPNSALQPDASADRDLALNRYNLLANDPFINREQLVRDTVEEFDGDPDRLVRQPPPPPSPPAEKPRVTLSIRGDDLNPAAPQYQNVMNLLLASGVQANLPAPQPPGGQEPTGPADVVDRERLRMAGADNRDQRAGGLVGVR